MNKAFEFCIPTRGTKVPHTPDWLHEIKYDGYRLRVEREGRRVRLFTRNGHDWTDLYPLISAAAAERHHPSSFDGEVVWLDLMASVDLNQRTDLDRVPTM